MKLRADNGRYGPSTYSRDVHIWLRPVAANYAIEKVTHDISTLPRDGSGVAQKTIVRVGRAICGCRRAWLTTRMLMLGEEGGRTFANVSGRPVTTFARADF